MAYELTEIVLFFLEREPDISLCKLNLLVYLSNGLALEANQLTKELIWQKGERGPYSTELNRLAIPLLSPTMREESRFKLVNPILDKFNQYCEGGYIMLAPETVLFSIALGLASTLYEL
jgi:hypothetical protein